MTVRLSPAEYTATVEKIAKVNDRAVKRGFSGRLEVKGERVEVTTHNEVTGFDVTEIFFETEVTGEAPSYNGWSFQARVDRVGETFTLATAPGVVRVDRDQVRPGVCDHCGFSRQRNTTYVVANETTGEIVNVGSTCIKDFLGWNASVVFFGEGDREIEIGSTGGFESTYSVDYVLAVAYAATRAFGWVPAYGEGRTTGNLVRFVLNPPNTLRDEDRQVLATVRGYAAEATAQAATVREFITSDAFAGESSYVDNLKAAVSAGIATGRQIGLLASAPQAYFRHQESLVAAVAAEETAKVSQHFGTAPDKAAGIKGSKETVTGVISAIRYIPGDYGTTTLYTILTNEGNVVKWFASSEALGETTDREVTITGTVKNHDEYRGTKSTVLTRCKEIVTA